MPKIDKVDPFDILGVMVYVEEGRNIYRGLLKMENGDFYIKDIKTGTRLELDDGAEVFVLGAVKAILKYPK